jgi:WD40 repeat protein
MTASLFACVGISLALSLFASLHAAPVTALSFSPDGASLVSNGERCLEIRSPKDAAVQRKIECDLPKITALSFHPRGTLLVVGGGEPGVRGEVHIQSWPEGKLLHKFGKHSDIVTSIAFNAEGTQLAAASSDHSARVWDIATDGAATEKFTLRGHAGPVLAVTFGPDCIVTASADRSLKVWASADGKLLRSFSHHTEAIHTLAFRPGKSECASAGDDRTVRIWQPAIGRMVRIIRGHKGPVFALAWARDGTAIYAAGKEGVIRRLDAESDAIQSEWRAHDDWIYALAISPDGAALASGDWTGNVRLHDPRKALPPNDAAGGK